jgi:hypothetical protein
MGQHHDRQDELAARAERRVAVGTEHGDGTVGEVDDAGRLVLADHTEGEQCGQCPGAEAEHDEEQEIAHGRRPRQPMVTSAVPSYHWSVRLVS